MKQKGLLLFLLLFAGVFIAGVALAGGTWEVDSADALDSALAEIAASGETEATIMLTADLEGTSFTGISGVQLTLASTPGQCYAIQLGNELQCPIVFDNVDASASELYCNGYPTVFSENSKLTVRGAVFGGGNQKTVQSTSLVIKGESSINNVSKRDFNIVAGSYKGSVTEDTYLELGGTLYTVNGNHITGANARTKYGGDTYTGDPLYVGGNVTMVIDLNPISTSSPAISGTYSSAIHGDLSLTFKAGYAHGISSQLGLSGEETKISGDIHLIIGDESYENTDRYARMSYNGSIYGAGEQMPHSDELFLVGGDIQIDAYENLWGWGVENETWDYPASLYGAAFSDVTGDVTINVHGSHLRNIVGIKERGVLRSNLTIHTVDVELDDHEYTSAAEPTDPRNYGNIQSETGGSV